MVENQFFMKTEKEFLIEFVLFDKKIRTNILAQTEELAKQKLFDAIIKKVKIEVITMPKNDWNDSMQEAESVLNAMGRFSNPNLQ